MPRILIADDNPSNADLLDAHLDGSGFETKLVHNGADALAAAREWNPDLILLDVMMPKMSGFEVCRRLRADPATAGVAVLMVTALDQPNDVETAVDAGTDDFITKPINKTELLLRVRAMLDSRAEPTQIDRALAYLGRVQQGLQ
ncbi:DNA-binding response regulator MtrA [Gemmata obscuriglobus]|uniref:Response regulator n=1 Tax=Gemmata obscuriglobus TaxID=114 RepID=A0A2Z3HCB3_9BACT|nr:response regulator [Gemmata obscuriglobus]AWM41207.1 response regulator [Gemmata obscuriglobus]QEG25451.1 DNA-binding response regulator MtrA [Gemmata obscuriglobus]VTR98618.1 chemotaxis protein : Response regulator receiver OS=Planctomyces limnophilus (strain ATCC 43296 / DSM 3776 / IFAM 1008 / 290) GN=Plim_2180 PE=4 SV=1: Response_reg [Gemmata obscuriglobus UQM 2246]